MSKNISQPSISIVVAIIGASGFIIAALITTFGPALFDSEDDGDKNVAETAPTNTSFPFTSTPSSTSTPQPFDCGLTLNSNGIWEPSDEAMNFLVDFKTIFLESDALVGPEITAGDSLKNTIRADLWWKDSKTPWNNAEISTFVHRDQSIELLGNSYGGREFSYPINSQGEGWSQEYVSCEAAAHLWRRIKGHSNIASVVYLHIDNRYILAPYDVETAEANLTDIIWEGNGDPRDDGMFGIRGFVPLQRPFEKSEVSR